MINYSYFDKLEVETSETDDDDIFSPFFLTITLWSFEVITTKSINQKCLFTLNTKRGLEYFVISNLNK